MLVSQIMSTGPIDDVFENRESPVGNELPERHASGKRLSVQDPRSHDHVGLSIQYRAHKIRHEPGIVLVIRVQHDDHVRAFLEGLEIAGLLISSVAPILNVDDDRET